MVPIQRNEPGEVARFSTTYAVVGHYGESSGIAMWRNAGERLPFVIATDVEPPVWYVTVGIIAVIEQAA